jgi:hypothetical protein
MSMNKLLSGQIQFPTQNNNIQTTTQQNQSTKSQTISDVNITPVGNTIDPSLYVYDGQTTLYINSTVNQTNNSVRLKYFDPVSGYPNLGGSNNFGFDGWNFDLTPQNYLNGCVTSSNLLGEQTSMYNNLETPYSTPNYLGMYSIDISNNNNQLDTSGNSNNTMFFSLTSQPYMSYQGIMYNGPGEQGIPTINNCNPNYTSLGSDTFLFSSQYWTQTNNEILLIYMVFSVSNTGSTYYNSDNLNNQTGGLSSPAPIISVIVYNKVISKEMLSSIGTGNTCPKPKVYSSGLINLKYLQTGQIFSADTATYFLFNNIPIILADGFGKQFATFGLYYIPPSETAQCQYLQDGGTGGTINGGFTIQNFLPQANINSGIQQTAIGNTLYGHFVVSISYSFNASQYNPGTSFAAQVLVKNIWRSPIAIYSSYSAYSVNDLTNKQVVLLFGRTSNGGSFLVTNTGTHLSQISNYGITTLGNFMSIMKIVITSYNNTYTLADYFINTTLINIINNTYGVNILPITLQPILEGTMMNPPSIINCPNMWYIFINSKNSVNLSVDPTHQKIFNEESSLYFGLPSSTLCDTGLCKYFNSELLMLGTENNSSYFGNSLYMGLNLINNQTYYMLLILPEALFNGIPSSTTNNNISIYSTMNTIFYFMINSSTSSAFVPSSNTITNTSNSSTSNNSGSVNNTYNISKIVLPVSNILLI